MERARRNGPKWLLALVAVTAILPLVVASPGPATAQSAPSTPPDAGAMPTTPAVPATPAVDPRTARNPELTERCLQARGAYVSGAYAAIIGYAGIAKRLRAAGLNAIVIDFKDDDGVVRHASALPEFQQPPAYVRGAGHFRDARAMIADLHALGLYVIARVVLFKDRILTRTHPELALANPRTGRPWVAPGGDARWLDPGNPAVQRVLVAFAREVQDLGVDEIQFDYVRYPVGVEVGAPRVNAAAADAPMHAQNIRTVLAAVDEALHIPLSVDVFGLTVFNQGDPTGIGQSIEEMAPYLEAITPMLYPANFDHDYFIHSTRRQYDIVVAGTANLRRRVGDRVAVRPFLQAFAFRAEGFGPAWIADEIRATRAGGGDGFLFWNVSTQYGTVFSALAGAARAP